MNDEIMKLMESTSVLRSELDFLSISLELQEAEQAMRDAEAKHREVYGRYKDAMAVLTAHRVLEVSEELKKREAKETAPKCATND